jgi:hypothetical protein
MVGTRSCTSEWGKPNYRDSHTLTITYDAPNGSDDDLSTMKTWEGNWLKIAVTHNSNRSATEAFLKILSWNSTMRTFHAHLYWIKDGFWSVSDLPLRYDAGSPLEFLFSFNYAGYYQFSGRLSGFVDGDGRIAQATLKAQGLYLSANAEEEGDDAPENGNPKGTVAISGSWMPASQVPQTLYFR